MSDETQPTSIPLVAVTGGLVHGGSTTFLLNLSKGFRQRGRVLPIVSLSGENAYAEDFAREGQPVHCIARDRLIYEDRLALGYRELARYKPSAVLSCLGGESFELLRVLPRGVARLGVVQAHEAGPYETIRRYAPYLDAVAGVSQTIQQHLQAMGELSGKRVEHIPYGIWFDTPAPARECNGRLPLRIIYLGRLVEEQKRISRLVALAQLLHAANLSIEFTIAGTGPDETSMRHELSELAWVRFTGAVANHETAALWRSHDIFVLLSDYEGLPLSLLEAMGQGVVPVVSDSPSGIRDVVNTDRGFRVPVGDVRQAFEIIANLAQDRSRLATLAQSAATFVREHYNAGVMAGRYLNLISELARGEVRWPSDCNVPAPLGLKPWIYSGVMRTVRRKLKPWLRPR